MNPHNLSLSVTQALLRSESAPDTGLTTPRSGQPEAKPFSISISREVGALGNAVASAVGRRLGWPVYDRDIVERIAEQMRQPAFQLAALDERPANWLEECLTALSTRTYPNTDIYLKYLAGAVRGLGKVGHCLIVGRGGHCILPAESTLRVRLIGDFADRVKVVMQRRNVPEREAIGWMEKTDLERNRFVKHYFGKDPADPHHYDLVLNTSRLTVDDCAEIIVDTLRRMEARPAAAPS